MYKRVLLKFSGEALKDSNSDFILNAECVNNLANVVKILHEQGVQIGIVIGAGNIYRGKLSGLLNIDQVPGDYMGMLGTVINAIAMSAVLKNFRINSVVFNALGGFADQTVTYSPSAAIKAMEEGKVVFFSAGTGKPFFTTDTAAIMRAIETDCQAILVGKNGVEGVYDKDPNLYNGAKFIKEVTYQKIIDMSLQIMDLSAIELIKDKDIQVRIFSMNDPQNFLKVAQGEDIGTTCHK